MTTGRGYAHHQRGTDKGQERKDQFRHRVTHKT